MRFLPRSLKIIYQRESNFEKMEKFEICHPSSADLTNLKTLFLNYPFKLFQQKFQGIKKEILAEFFAEGFLSSSNLKDSISYIIKTEDEILSAGSVGSNSWHTQNFGIQMGKISTFITYPDQKKFGNILIDLLLDEAKKLNLKHLSCRLDADDWENIHLLESMGFYLVDCSIKFGLKLPSSVQPSKDTRIEILPYTGKYLEQIMEIASTSHQINHFYADKNLPGVKTQQLFANWVKKLSDGKAQSIFVALKDSLPIGFVIFLENKAFNQKLGLKIAILDYVVLDSKLQGRGFGSELLAHSLNYLNKFYDQVELRTSHNNYQALNTYQKFGFKIISTDIVLHYLL